MMDYQNVTFEKKEEIGLLTINRPKKLNALNHATMDEIEDVLGKAKSDQALRVLIITGAGDKAFVAGADVSEFVDLGLNEGFEFTRRGNKIFRALECLGIPTIAAVNGLALGGGCELAMSCTFRILSDSARFGLPELALGVIPGYGGTQRLARMIGKSRALWVILTGETIGAEEALSVGWANRVVAREALMDEAFKVAKTICSKGPLAVKYALIAVNHGTETDLETGLVIESAMTSLVLTSEDKKEGVSSFLEKRRPVFRGR
jgi:enoyl-CoA hydratase